MSDDREPYSADEKATFGWVDDELATEQPLEEDILGAEEYQGADKHGTTPAEERRGLSLEEELREERPDEPQAPVSDDWREAPDPRADTLVDSWDGYADEAAVGEDTVPGALHVTTEDRERAEELRAAE